MDVVTHHHGLRRIEGNQKLWDTKRIIVASGVAKVRSNIAFPVLVAYVSDKTVILKARELIGSSLPVPVPAEPHEFNPEELSQPFRDLWDNISEITFEGNDEPVDKSTLQDPKEDTKPEY